MLMIGVENDSRLGTGVRRNDRRKLLFESEEAARAALAERYPMLVQTEKYAAGKRTRVIRILEDDAWPKCPERRCESATRAAHDELQPGPGFVDGTDLDVDEAERKREGADRVFRDVGLHLRRFLRPRDPDDCRWPELRAKRMEHSPELRRPHDEHVRYVDGRVDGGHEPDRRRQRLEQRQVVPGSRGYEDAEAFLDAEFLRERRARVSGRGCLRSGRHSHFACEAPCWCDVPRADA